MKKVFTFLTGIFVCALLTSGASAQSQDSNPAQTNQSETTVAISPATSSAAAAALSSEQIAQDIAEAKQLLKARQTSASAVSVTLATLDPETSQINLVSVAKDSFLVSGSNLLATSQLGRSLRIHVINANGVNTAVTVTDVATGRAFLPLVVQYPIVKSGSVTETAYYTSAHPALLST